MQVNGIARKFVFIKGNNERLLLEDINPDWGNARIMEHYSQLYAELTNANIMDKGINEGVHEVHFRSLAGTKG